MEEPGSHVPTCKKRRDSTLAEKVKILELLQQPKASQSSVARNMGLSQSTISRVMKKREEILERWKQNENPGRKRNRPFKHAKVDEALLEWFLFAKANKLPISGPILMRQAEAIAKEIGCPHFKPSNGWLWRWKERYRLFYRGDPLPAEIRHSSVLHSKYVTILPTATSMIRLNANSPEQKYISGSHVPGEWDKHMQSVHHGQFPQEGSLSRSLLLARIAKDYHLEDIFCAVDSSFQFRVLPTLEMTLTTKEAVTLWFCCNVNGTEKLKLLAIHNLRPESLGTHCLSPVSLKATANGCLTDTLLNEWLLNWDAKLGRQGKKVLLAFTAHNAGPKVKLRNISLCIFPKDNPSSNHQFGLELVNEFKLLYRQFLLERLEEDINVGVRTEICLAQKISEITLLEASYTMNKAWLRVAPTTIKRSFQKQEAIRFLCLAKNDLPDTSTRPQKTAYFPISQERSSSAVLSADRVSYKSITVKEENIDGHENFESETGCTRLEIANCNAKTDFSSVAGKVRLTELEPPPKHQEENQEPTIVVKKEDPEKGFDPEEIRQACDVIQYFLLSEKQDLSIFCALQSQVERCLANSSSRKTFHFLARK
ncbi:tigger transposable element-derived protein 3-like [Gastrophryne carolinensis]